MSITIEEEMDVRRSMAQWRTGNMAATILISR